MLARVLSAFQEYVQPAALHVAVAVIAVARPAGAHYGVSLVQRACGTTRALRAVAVAAQASLAGDVAQRVVGHRDIIGRWCGRIFRLRGVRLGAGRGP